MRRAVDRPLQRGRRRRRHLRTDVHRPTLGIKPLDNSQWHTYTEEQPNALRVEEVPRFLAQTPKLYPQHFAMIALVARYGRHPSELRPLRRSRERVRAGLAKVISLAGSLQPHNGSGDQGGDRAQAA
jgi:hypothetical protein